MYTVQLLEGSNWRTVTTLQTNVGSVRIDGLEPETNYSVRLRRTAVAVDNGSSFFACFRSTVVPFTTRRAFTSNFSAISSLSDLRIALGWTKLPDATSYYMEIYRGHRANADALERTLTAYNSSNSLYSIDFAPSTGETFLIRMQALFGDGIEPSGWEEIEVSAGLPRVTQLDAGANFDPVAVQLDWSDPDSFSEGYELERSTTLNGTYVPIATVTPETKTEYLDDAAEVATRYYYRLRSIDSGGAVTSGWTRGSGWSSTPPATGNLGIVWLEDGYTWFNWTPIPGVQEYAIERFDLVDGQFAEWREVGRASNNHFLDGHATEFPVFPSNSYRYRVKAVTNDPWVGDSAWSPIFEVTTPAHPPATVDAVLRSGTRIAVSWASVFGASYEVQRRRGNFIGPWNNWAALASPGSGTTGLSDADLSGFTRFQYRVRSVNAAGGSAWKESPAVSLSAGVPLGVVAEPGSAVGANNCDENIRVTWEEVAGATGYVVRRSLSNGTMQQDFVLGAGSTEYLDKNLTPFTVYKY